MADTDSEKNTSITPTTTGATVGAALGAEIPTPSTETQEFIDRIKRTQSTVNNTTRTLSRAQKETSKSQKILVQSEYESYDLSSHGGGIIRFMMGEPNIKNNDQNDDIEAGPANLSTQSALKRKNKLSKNNRKAKTPKINGDNN